MGNAKQCNLKELVTVTQFAREAEFVGDRAIYSKVPGCCERKEGGGQSRNRSRWSDCQTDSWYSKAADESCVYQERILVQKKSSVIGGRRNFLTKMCCRRRQGYLPKLVTKIHEVPTTFESLVVKRNSSDGQCDRPLYGNFAQRTVSGILSLLRRMKIPAVRLSFRAGLATIPTHGVALQRYGWPP